jgi:transposase
MVGWRFVTRRGRLDMGFARARGAAVEDLRGKRQHVSSFLLRLGLHYPGDKTWTKAHMNWLAKQKLAHAEQRIAFEEMLLAVRQVQERIARLEAAIRGAIPDWSLAAAVDALMAMRGIDMVSATALLAEIGDLSRFRTPRELMAYLGLVPSEHSTGDKVQRGGITKAGKTGGRGAFWWSAHGPTDIRPGSEKRNRTRSQRRRRRFARSPGKRSTGFTPAIGR